MSSETSSELLALSQKLLDAVATGDWQTYRVLVADDLTCFEPEARGQLVEGLAFFACPKEAQRIGECIPEKGVRWTLRARILSWLRRVAKVLEPKHFRVLLECFQQRLWFRVGASGCVAGVRPRIIFEEPLGELVYDAFVGAWVRELHCVVVDVLR